MQFHWDCRKFILLSTSRNHRTTGCMTLISQEYNLLGPRSFLPASTSLQLASTYLVSCRMMELLQHVLNSNAIEAEAHVGGSKEAENRRANSMCGGNVKSIVRLYERRSGSKSIQEEGRQEIESSMEAKQSNFQASPKRGVIVPEATEEPTKHGNLVEMVVKCPNPPPESKASSDSLTKDVRGVKRKSSVYKDNRAIVQAIEHASHAITDSVDRIHSAISEVAGDTVNEYVMLHTEFNYLKKRDRRLSRNQQSLVTAINSLTEVITTGIQKTAPAGAASENVVGGGDAD